MTTRIDQDAARLWALCWLLVLAGVGAAGPLGCSSSTDEDGGNSGSAGLSAGGSSGAGSDSDAGNGGNATGVLEFKPCGLGEMVGGFRIQLAAEYTGVHGAVRSGAVPSDVPEVVSEAGDCRLLSQPNLFCDPPCGSGQTCGATGSCIDYPTNQNVGTVTVQGLEGELVMDPSPSETYTNPAQPALPHPGFMEGADIVLSAAGGDLAPFTLRGEGVAALIVSEDNVMATAGEPLTLSWQAGDTSDAVQLRIKVEFNRHGGTPSWLECNAADTGSFEIPPTLVDELLALEVSGWPTVTMTRGSVDSVELDVGCVEFAVFSQAVRELEVSGVVSCDDNNPCPDAAECQANLTCPE